MKILMVCLGNICRSPLAEGILQKKAAVAGLHWQIDSAGTNGFHTGEAPHRFSQKIAAQHGIDISGQVSRQFTLSDFDTYDRIYVMAEDVMAELKQLTNAHFNSLKTRYFLDELNPGGNVNVPDPWYGTEEGYTTVFNLISRTCDALIKNYFATQKQTV